MSASTSRLQMLKSMQSMAVSLEKNRLSPSTADSIELHIAEHCWEVVNYLNRLPSHLHAKVMVNGCAMHFEAYLLGEDGEIMDPKQNRAIALVKQALRDDQPWQTILFEKRCYVVVAIPYGCDF